MRTLTCRALLLTAHPKHHKQRQRQRQRGRGKEVKAKRQYAHSHATAMPEHRDIGHRHRETKVTWWTAGGAGGERQRPRESRRLALHPSSRPSRLRAAAAATTAAHPTLPPPPPHPTFSLASSELPPPLPLPPLPPSHGRAVAEDSTARGGGRGRRGSVLIKLSESPENSGYVLGVEFVDRESRGPA